MTNEPSQTFLFGHRTGGEVHVLGRPRRAPRVGRTGVALVATATLFGALSACGDDDDVAPTATGAVPTDAAGAPTDSDGGSDLAGTSWTLASALTEGEEVAAAAVATLEFGTDGTTLAGSTGCNQFSGTYSQAGSDLTIAIGPVTRAACTDPAATAQEAAILGQLPEVASFSAGEQLVLRDSSDATLFTYDAGMTTIEGTSWTATGVNNGREAVVSTDLTETVTAEFGSDGALSGFAGCNTYRATYALSGDDGISVTDVATTRKACEEDAMTLETQYLAALAKATVYDISGTTLTLRDSTGATQVTYQLAT